MHRFLLWKPGWWVLHSFLSQYRSRHLEIQDCPYPASERVTKFQCESVTHWQTIRADSIVNPGPKARTHTRLFPLSIAEHPFINSLSTNRIVALLMFPYRRRIAREAAIWSGLRPSSFSTLSKIALPPGCMAQTPMSGRAIPLASRIGTNWDFIFPPIRSGT